MTTRTTTITNPAAVRRLAVGLWTRAYALREATGHRPNDAAVALATAALDNYAEAAHVALTVLGAQVGPAPFGLRLAVQEVVNAAPVKPAATSPGSLATWRTELTDAVIAALQGGAR